MSLSATTKEQISTKLKQATSLKHKMRLKTFSCDIPSQKIFQKNRYLSCTFSIVHEKVLTQLTYESFFFGRSLNIVQKVEAPKQQFFIRKWSHTNHQGGCRQCLVRGYKTALVLNIGFFVTAFVYLFTKEEPICAKKAFGPIEAEASENYNRAALFC